MADMIHRSPAPEASGLRRTWGTCDIDPGRYGGTHIRVRILPPSITPRERRGWLLLHRWPALGFVAAVIAAVLLTPLIGVPNAVCLAALAWLTPLLALWLAAGRVAGRTRELWSNDRRDGSHDAGWCTLDAVVHELDEADRALRAGEIDEATHRARWRAVYDAAAQAPARTVSSSRA